MGFLEKLTKVPFGLKGRPQRESNVEVEIINGRIVTQDASESSEQEEHAPLSSSWCEEVSEGQSEDKPDTSEKSMPDMDESEFQVWLKVGGRAERTCREYHYELEWWQKKADRKRKKLEELKAREIEASLKRTHSDTALRKLAALKTWSRWRLREGDGRLFMEMEKVIKPKKSRSLPKDLGSDRFHELKIKAKEMLKKRDREGIWIGLMLCGGLRISEVKTCRPYQKGVQVIGKGNKERYIPLPPWLLDAMQEMKRDGRGGWALSRQAIAYRLGRHGLKKPHSLRHTYASELIRRGYKIEQVQKLLGHENIKTTTIYARVDVPEDVIDRLGM